MTGIALPNQPADHTRPTPHVLIIGIDGVRYDAIRRLRMPHLDRVEAAGFLAPVRVDDCAPTISGPSWASIFTGTLATTHGIYDNDLTTGRLKDYPDLLSRIVQEQPRVATFAAAGWAPLVSAVSGGPLLAGGGMIPADLADDSIAELHRVDDDVVAASIQFLTDHDGSHGSAIFTYLHAVDAVGHGPGTGAEYDAMIEASDSRLGMLLDGVLDRPHSEEWTVVVVTDHGHRDGGGHGGNDGHERTAWIAACGPGVPQGEPQYPHQVDVAVHVLDLFGIAPSDPAVVGRSFGARHQGVKETV